MKNSKLIALIGFIKPKIKKEKFMLENNINMTKLEINNLLANYYNFTNTLNKSSFQNSYALQTKTYIMKLVLLIIKKLTEPKVFCLFLSKKQILNNWSFVWFQLWYSFIGDKNKNRRQSFLKLDPIFDLTQKTFKKILFKKFFRKIEKFILFLKQKMKQNFFTTFSFFIKTLNFKIINIFKVFGKFFNLFDFFHKIIFFMWRQKKILYKIQHFFDYFFNGITIKNFFLNKHVTPAKLRCVFNKTQKIVVDSQLYKVDRNKLYFKMSFLKQRVGFDFSIQKYYQKFGYRRKFLHTFLFYNFNWRKKNQLFMYLQKRLKSYNKKVIFTTTKTRKSYIDFFYFDLPKQRSAKTRFNFAKKDKINIWYKRNINNIRVKLSKLQTTFLKYIFNKMMQSIKMILNLQDFVIITRSCFTKIKKIVLKLASFVIFFLSKFLWKFAKKQHPKISNMDLVNKYWIFIQKLAIFYFFEKVN